VHSSPQVHSELVEFAILRMKSRSVDGVDVVAEVGKKLSPWPSSLKNLEHTSVPDILIFELKHALDALLDDKEVRGGDWSLDEAQELLGDVYFLDELRGRERGWQEVYCYEGRCYEYIERCA